MTAVALRSVWTYWRRHVRNADHYHYPETDRPGAVGVGGVHDLTAPHPDINPAHGQAGFF
jgi:hypothetical protein